MVSKYGVLRRGKDGKDTFANKERGRDLLVSRAGHLIPSRFQSSSPGSSDPVLDTASGLGDFHP